MEEWTETVRDYLTRYNFTEQLVLNVDETRSEPREQTQLRIVCPDREGRVRYVPCSGFRTTFNAISADGKVWLSLYIYVDDSMADVNRAGTIPVYIDQKPTRDGWPRLYAKTERGFMPEMTHLCYRMTISSMIIIMTKTALLKITLLRILQRNARE